MKRTGVFRLTLLMVVACYQIAVAQPGGSMQRIGVLTPNHAINFADNLDALRQGLRDLGYIEGKNFAIEFRHGDGQLDRLAELIADLVRIKVSVIVISSSPAALAAREITKDIPIVFSVTGDAVAAGLVASLARPGGNLTGVTTGASELYGKRLELLKEAVPRLSHAGLMFNPETRTAHVGVKETQAAGQALGIQTQLLEVRNAKEIERGFEIASRSKVRGMTFIQNPPITTNIKLVVDLTTKHKIPAMYANTDWCNDGGLMCYGRYIPDTYRRLAVYVDKILKGTKAADLPVEQWTKLQFVINLKTAKQIGLTIPQWTLMKADRVIKEASAKAGGR